MATLQAVVDATSLCPYVGLRSYTLEEREYFFGRKRDQEVIFSNVSSARLTILYGGSGVGKSSVVQAGVMPLLQHCRRTAAVYVRSWQSPTFLHGLKKECLRVFLAIPPRPLAATFELRPDELLELPLGKILRLPANKSLEPQLNELLSLPPAKFLELRLDEILFALTA